MPVAPAGPGTALRKRNIVLQRSGSSVDQARMPRTQSASSARQGRSPRRKAGKHASPESRPQHTGAAAEKSNRTRAAATTPAARTPQDITLRQLAHELNSLLDGSMRCLGMARSSLQHESSVDGQPAHSIDDGLGKALAAMKHMAALLHRALRLTADPDAPSPGAIFHSDHTLEPVFADILQIVHPLAHAHSVALETAIAPGCGELTAGPLGVVLLNGLRNAIESCAARSNPAERRVRCSIDGDGNADDRTLRIAIEDTGHSAPGAPRRADSHGVGLTLSQQIVRELGGELALLIRPNGDGATLRVSIPVRSLMADE
jgi:signal transduction histidine kinase